MLVDISSHVSLDELSIKQSSSHDTSQEAEIFEIVLLVDNMTCGIDVHGHLVVDAREPQPEIGIKDLFRHQLEPLAGQAPGLDTGFSSKLDPPALAQVLPAQGENCFHAVFHEGLLPTPDNDPDVPLLPGSDQLFADALAEPVHLLFERLALYPLNVLVREERLGLLSSLVVAVDIRALDDSVLGRDELHDSGSHPGVVPLQKLELGDVGGFSKVKALHVGKGLDPLRPV
mmetsp:Transcript_16726/g.45860  ORF Transcript_16726/g.45860 Transcript_16726/m.45860 type:complete len:230 (-) Transcript_16726:1240-1929(-)